MPAIHPPLSGFPLTCTTLLLLVELLYLVRSQPAAWSLLRTFLRWATVVATGVAFFSGYHASSQMGEIPQAASVAVSAHHSWGRLLLFVAIGLGVSGWLSGVAVHGRRLFSVVYLLMLTLHTVLTVWVGALGGRLVFQHGVGVVAPASVAPTTAVATSTPALDATPLSTP
jgi:uncharacterized membrane protein